MKVLVTADEIGVVKQITFSKGVDTSLKDGQKPESIIQYCKTPESSNTSRILYMVAEDSRLYTMRINGLLCIYDMKELIDDDFKLITKTHVCEDKPVALILQEEQIIIAFESYKVFITDKDGNLQRELTIPQPKKTKKIACFEANPFKRGQFVIGGEENDAKVIEIGDDIKVTQSFKNVPNNHLDIRTPVSIKLIRFVSIDEFITVTKYGQLREYDMNNVKPVGDYKISNNPLIQATLCNNNKEIILSDTTSFIGKYSLVKLDNNATKVVTATMGTVTKPSLKLLGKYTEGSNTGATHSIDNFKDKYIGCGGLDRYLRVFDLKTRKLVAKVYSGTQISSVIILEGDEDEDEEKVIQSKRKAKEVDDQEHGEQEGTEEEEEDDDGDSEYEELWRNLGNGEIKKRPRRI